MRVVLGGHIPGVNGLNFVRIWLMVVMRLGNTSIANGTSVVNIVRIWWILLVDMVYTTSIKNVNGTGYTTSPNHYNCMPIPYAVGIPLPKSVFLFFTSAVSFLLLSRKVRYICVELKLY